jgi:hypothetical protein
MAPSIHLRLHARRVDLRHEHLPDRPPQLAFALTHVLTDRDLRDIGAVLIKQPPPDPLRGVALLARRLAIGRKRLVDQRPVRAELRRRPRHRRALRRRQRRRQRLTHRTTVHPMALRERPDRQPLPIAVTPDLLERSTLDPTPTCPPIRAQDERQPSGHDRTEVGPVRAIAMGPVQTIVLMAFHSSALAGVQRRADRPPCDRHGAPDCQARSALRQRGSIAGPVVTLSAPPCRWLETAAALAER